MNQSKRFVKWSWKEWLIYVAPFSYHNIQNWSISTIRVFQVGKQFWNKRVWGKHLQLEFEGTVFVLDASRVESGRVFPRRVEPSSGLTSQVAESRRTEPSWSLQSLVPKVQNGYFKVKTELFLSSKESWNKKPIKLDGWALKTRAQKHYFGPKSSRVDLELEKCLKFEVIKLDSFLPN